VGVFVARHAGGVRVAVTGAGSNGVFRLPEFEEALSRNFAPEALDNIAVPEDEVNSDIPADAAYRAHLEAALARRPRETPGARGRGGRRAGLRPRRHGTKADALVTPS